MICIQILLMKRLTSQGYNPQGTHDNEYTYDEQNVNNIAIACQFMFYEICPLPMDSND